MTNKYLVYMAPNGELELWTCGPWFSLRHDEKTRTRQDTSAPWLHHLGESDRDEHLQPPEYWGRELLGEL